jgi:nicotinamidase-related amidase
MKTALVIIDIQNEYFPGGKRELVGPQAAAQQAARLLDYFRQAALPRYFIQHISTGPKATAFLPGTPAIEISAAIAPMDNEPIVVKHYPNSFRGTDLLEMLREVAVERLVITGMQTHMCIDATTRAAFDYGFDCLVAADACATRDLAYDGTTVPAAHVHAAFLAALHGTYANVCSTEELLGQLKQER